MRPEVLGELIYTLRDNKCGFRFTKKPQLVACTK